MTDHNKPEPKAPKAPKQERPTACPECEGDLESAQHGAGQWGDSSGRISRCRRSRTQHQPDGQDERKARRVPLRRPDEKDSRVHVVMIGDWPSGSFKLGTGCG